ncbi:hypothetical protein CDAR_244131 [Caerostris darwini]|uniref:Uncharacterized protein n=1 Tax=Caerostris darwini TaxID=1538125 RepID=A0AAV4RHK4_9ARAC|nr:hypothetical protein CDAR_244131 [Caerostris darwini]
METTLKIPRHCTPFLKTLFEKNFLTGGFTIHQGHPEDVKAFQRTEDVKAFQKTEDVKAFQKREDVKAFQKTEDVKAFQKTEDVKAFQRTEDVKAFQKTEDTKAFQKREDVKAFQKTEDVKAFQRTENIKAFQKTEDTNAFQKREDVKAFQKTEDVKAFQRTEDVKAFQKTEDTKAFQKREDVKAFQKTEDVKAFQRTEDVNFFPKRILIDNLFFLKYHTESLTISTTFDTKTHIKCTITADCEVLSYKSYRKFRQPISRFARVKGITKTFQKNAFSVIHDSVAGRGPVVRQSRLCAVCGDWDRRERGLRHVLDDAEGHHGHHRDRLLHDELHDGMTATPLTCTDVECALMNICSCMPVK